MSCQNERYFGWKLHLIARVKVAIITFRPITVATDLTLVCDFAPPKLKAKENTPIKNNLPQLLICLYNINNCTVRTVRLLIAYGFFDS
jgi:uncharacterized protein YegL